MAIWTVPGVVKRVVDGDTLVVDLDQGWRSWRHDERVRLAGVNAPELDTAEGKAAAAFVRALLPAGTVVTVVSRELDKYGRVLGVVRLEDGRLLADLLLTSGHARPAL